MGAGVRGTAILAALAGLAAAIIAAAGSGPIGRLEDARDRAYGAACVSNLKQLSMGLLMYMQDWDDTYPATRWNDAVSPYVSRGTTFSLFTCPASQEKAPTYAMNAKLRRLHLGAVKSPAQTVALFESKPGKNLSGGRELLPSTPRHRAGCVIGFVDAHVTMTPKSDFRKLNWDPRRAPTPK